MGNWPAVALREADSQKRRVTLSVESTPLRREYKAEVSQRGTCHGHGPRMRGTARAHRPSGSVRPVQQPPSRVDLARPFLSTTGHMDRPARIAEVALRLAEDLGTEREIASRIEAIDRLTRCETRGWISFWLDQLLGRLTRACVAPFKAASERQKTLSRASRALITELRPGENSAPGSAVSMSTFELARISVVVCQSPITSNARVASQVGADDERVAAGLTASVAGVRRSPTTRRGRPAPRPRPLPALVPARRQADTRD